MGNIEVAAGVAGLMIVILAFLMGEVWPLVLLRVCLRLVARGDDRVVFAADKSAAEGRPVKISELG